MVWPVQSARGVNPGRDGSLRLKAALLTVIVAAACHRPLPPERDGRGGGNVGRDGGSPDQVDDGAADLADAASPDRAGDAGVGEPDDAGDAIDDADDALDDAPADDALDDAPADALDGGPCSPDGRYWDGCNFCWCGPNGVIFCSESARACTIGDGGPG